MSGSVQDAIARTVNRVQALPPLRRALLAREALAMAAGSTLSVGPREARLRKLLAWMGRSGVVTISFVLLAKRYVTGRKFAADGGPLQAIFIGIGAMREQVLRENVEAEHRVTTHFVDQRRADGFRGLPAPSLLRVIRYWMHSMYEALLIISERDPDFAPLDIMSTLTLRTHDLAYLLAWFENLRDHHPNLHVFCSTVDLPAHAACLVGLHVEYRQHGFLARTLVFPSIAAMVALTSYEGRYVASRVPGLAMTINSPRLIGASTSATIALTGDYQARDPASVTSLVELAHTSGLLVVVRPHPKGYDELWSGVRGRKNVVFDAGGRFEDFLEKWRPAFVASWFSTTLLDGLRAGAVPITFSRANGILLIPIETIALTWPDQRSTIEHCMSDSTERHRVLNGLTGALQQ